MANGDDLDPGDYNAPAGSGTALGMSPGNPLYDWYSQLKPDDLAKLLQNPQGHAADLAARGIPVPPADQLHDANDAMGTPSRSNRFDTTPASPLDEPALPKSDRLPLYSATQDAAKTVRGLGAQSPFPGGTTTEGATTQPPNQPPNAVYIPNKGWVDRTTGQPVVQTPGQTQPPAPAPAPVTPGGGVVTPPAVPPPAPITPYTPQLPPAARKATPAEAKTIASAGSPLDISTDEAKADTATPEGRKKLEDALSTIGKAMQGVKMPEPLKPPGIGAPTVRGTQSAGASNIASLLQSLSRTSTGQVPPSVAPVLKLLGRV